MADDEDEVANVNDSLQQQSDRIDEGLGTELVDEQFPNQEAVVSEGEGVVMVEAVVDGSENEGFEFGGSAGVEAERCKETRVEEGVEMVEAVLDGAVNEGFEFCGSEGVEAERCEETRDEGLIGEEGGDEIVDVKGGSDLRSETVVASESYGVNDLLEEKGEFEKNLAVGCDVEKNGESSKKVEGEDGEEIEARNSDLIGMGIGDGQTEDASEEKGDAFGNNLAARGDVEKIDEPSKKVEEEGAESNAAGKSDLIGMVVEDHHMKDIAVDKGEEFVKNLAAEQCALMTVCDGMEQIDHFSEKVREEDGEESNAAGSDSIGKGITDFHMNTDVEEKVGDEVNLTVEVMTAIGDTGQMDESWNSSKKEEVVGDYLAGNTDLVRMVTKVSHLNNAIVEDKGEEFEKKMTLEQCALVTNTGDLDQIVDSRNKAKEDGVGEENVAEDSEKVGVEFFRDHTDKSGNVDNEARDGDEEMGSGEENANNKDKLDEGLSAPPDVEFFLGKVVLEPTTGDGDEEMGSLEENTVNKEKLEEDFLAAPDVEFSLHKVMWEPTTSDEDGKRGSEQKNTGNTEKFEISLSAAPDVEVSQHNVVLEPATSDRDEKMGLEVENKEKLEYLLTAPDVEFSVYNVVPETAAGDGDEEMGLEFENKENKEKLEGDLSAALDAEFSLHTAVPEIATGDGEEEMGLEEENSENKRKLGKDLSAAPDVEFSLHNVELEPTAGKEDEKFVDGEEPSRADPVDTHIDMPDSENSNIKPKRGRKPSKVAITKKTEEDLCFICFDGGDLVVCDRRGCPKVYHPSCVNRDEAFFKAKGRWNCGWHLCSKCEKNAQYMCLTCTFSLCKGCIKDTVFYSVRGNKGFCETCFKTVKLIESKEQEYNEENSNFDDKTCWESMFKDYWMDLKERLQLTSEELAQVKSLWSGSDVAAPKQKPADESKNVNDNVDSASNISSGNVVAVTPKRKKNKRLSKSVAKSEDSPSGSDSSGNDNKNKRRKTKKQATPLRKRGSSGNNGDGVSTGSEWASTELLKFVMHMRKGDASVLSQFEVQELLLEYIKTNKLRDPRRKSQIICDAMLKGLFKKQRVGHFEMLKLLESHFLMKEDGNVDEFHGSSVDNGASPSDELAKADAPAKVNKDKKRKMRRKGFGRGTQSNTADYAAIDIHNISLVFLRRNLMEILLEDVDNFQDKIVGGFVRIRITGSNQIQDMYRLVQIVGTTKAPMPYKVGKRTTDISLEIQNLNKKEVVSIDIISNQEFTEDECNRLRQSIKCGLIPRLTVGDILEKAMDLQAARVSDWLETETVRLSHLCDRASDMGKRKELRENVEKLQNLKKPEERQRRLEEIPEVHSDPKMDPSYESDEEEETGDRKQETFLRPRGSGLTRLGKDTLSPRKGDHVATDSWSGTKGRELGRSLSSKGYSSKGDETNITGELTRVHGRSDENELLHARDKQKAPYNSQLGGGNTHTTVASESFGGSASDSPQTISSLSSQTVATVNESEKIWHYKDPSGKVQGPFSIVQLRKWNSTGFFPKDLAIWKINEDQDNGILLLDALAGNFPKETKMNRNISNKFSVVQSGLSSFSQSGRSAANGSLANSASPSQISSVGHARLSVDVSMSAGGTRSSGYDSRNEYTNLPSPTPNQIMGSTGGETSVNRLSSVSRAVSGPVSADSTQLYQSSTTSPAANPYQTSYSQQTRSPGYHMQQTNPSPASVNVGVESRISVSASPSMMQSAPQPSGRNASNSQIPLSASNTFNQWSNPSNVSSEKHDGSFPNQGFSGTPAPTTWRPPTAPVNQQSIMQPMLVPDQSWRPVSGNNPNMGQVTPQMNPNWAVQGMVPVIGNAAAGWIPSGNTMPGYAAQVYNQVGSGIMNPGWTVPTSMNTNTNQPWTSAGQGSLPNATTRNNNTSNQPSWAANGQNVNDQYSNKRKQRGDGGYHQRGGGHDSQQPRVCEYYLSNRCRKGSSCKWLHPQR